MNITEGFHSGAGAEIPPPASSDPSLIDRLMEWAHVLMWEPGAEREEIQAAPPSHHLCTDKVTELHARRIGGQGFASLCRDGVRPERRSQTPIRRLRGAAIDDADLDSAEMILRAPHVPVFRDI